MILRQNALSLNIERRRIPPRNAQRPIVLTELPFPKPGNSKSTAGAELAPDWSRIAAALARLKRQQRVRGPVVVTLKFAERRRVHYRIETLAKAPLELLASLDLIDSSDARTVRQLVLCWGDIDGLDIRVEPVRSEPRSAVTNEQKSSITSEGAE